MLNKLTNKIINSNKLFIVVLLLPLVLCATIGVSNSSKLNNLKKITNNNALNNTEYNLSTIEDQSTTTTYETTTLYSPKNTALRDNRLSLKHPSLDANIDFTDIKFLMRVAIFLVAFCFIIFGSLFIKSFNKKSNLMYGILDNKCHGDEERLMGKNDDFFEDDDEVVMFDALDFKKEHYKDYKD